jgi:putative tricarboxylic transport membrane protein
LALDKVIALVFLLVCLLYGYVAFYTMDATLPPFMKHNPIWPSSLPKILAVLGIVASLFVILGKSEPQDEDGDDINYRQLANYEYGKAVAMLLLMVGYALGLSTLGFLLSTCLFLFLGTWILGERRWLLSIIVSLIAAFFVWYLVQQVLGIYLRPLPSFFAR